MNEGNDIDGGNDDGHSDAGFDDTGFDDTGPDDRDGGGRTKTYLTAGGITITRSARPEPRGDAIASLAGALDERLGVLLTSSFEYPGRYTRWDRRGPRRPPARPPASGAASTSP